MSFLCSSWSINVVALTVYLGGLESQTILLASFFLLFLLNITVLTESVGQLVVTTYKEQGEPQIVLAVPLPHCRLGTKIQPHPGALKLSNETHLTKIFL